ncbi:PREDICTED: S-type anion channel SLAH4-like isoform X2 [Tarenaya hassleriana]|uniref:S-type anion channel SLAH4-like isoform X2 n=1 Tax=Tarenaya hassleriana TaxID=28532 RepID=UPI00053C8197|nr:PREDICTED: S-type anion channel SLAH4-like isoform X2 [Tarenaya hassleriana]
MASPEIQLAAGNATAPSKADAKRRRRRSVSMNLSLTSVLTNFHAGYFRISLSLAGQALLWKTIARRRVIPTLHPSSEVVAVIWSVAVLSLLLLSSVYLLKCVLCFRMVKSEFLHEVGVNYLFVPWISCLLLLQSAPFWGPETTPYLVFWWVFAVPVIVLDVKIYGQWFTKGKRFLTAVANPTSQMSVIGNLVGAYGAGEMGWKESAVCLFALGMVHYLVLFVTLSQRLSGSERLPAMLRPVFFLFFAAPSIASLAWQSISGGFRTPSKMLFFLSLFIFTSLLESEAIQNVIYIKEDGADVDPEELKSLSIWNVSSCIV